MLREICHLRQKSAIDLAWYGLLKLSIKLKPNTWAAPIAMSEYPEKSQYIWYENNIVAITDSMVGTGLADGIYPMSDGRKFFTKKGDVARLVGSKIIVGSILTMNYALRNLVEKCGLSLYEASRVTCLNPAIVVGVDREVGSIEVGKKANLAILAPDFECLGTFIEGKLIYQRK